MNRLNKSNKSLNTLPLIRESTTTDKKISLEIKAIRLANSCNIQLKPAQISKNPKIHRFFENINMTICKSSLFVCNSKSNLKESSALNINPFNITVFTESENVREQEKSFDYYNKEIESTNDLKKKSIFATFSGEIHTNYEKSIMPLLHKSYTEYQSQSTNLKRVKKFNSNGFLNVSQMIPQTYVSPKKEIFKQSVKKLRLRHQRINSDFSFIESPPRNSKKKQSDMTYDNRKSSIYNPKKNIIRRKGKRDNSLCSWETDFSDRQNKLNDL